MVPDFYLATEDFCEPEYRRLREVVNGIYRDMQNRKLRASYLLQHPHPNCPCVLEVAPGLGLIGELIGDGLVFMPEAESPEFEEFWNKIVKPPYLKEDKEPPNDPL